MELLWLSTPTKLEYKSDSFPIDVYSKTTYKFSGQVKFSHFVKVSSCYVGKYYQKNVLYPYLIKMK